VRAVRMLALAVLVLTLFVPAAHAADDAISIEPVARYDLEGGLIYVELHVRCESPYGEGAAFVELRQFYPESYADAFGESGNTVACSGTTVESGVTVYGCCFDPGRALARAAVVPAGSSIPTATAERWIDIRV
jgi:hypothetical protein